ncbi:Inositol polyphosphate phosphatase OCRL [Salix suchowensis]|nr:Inositol polyphosphate phosphatase OCRL [Salix suchowensis]
MACAHDFSGRITPSIHRASMEAVPILVEENVKMQVKNLSKASTITAAWANKSPKGREVWLHGWVYDIAAGKLRDLGISLGPPKRVTAHVSFEKLPTTRILKSTTMTNGEQPPKHTDRLLVQLASYNTNLQALRGLPQDLVDWLSPTLQVSSFLSREKRAPDIVAVDTGTCSERGEYSLVAKIVNVGVALLVYALDEGVARSVCDVQTGWSSCGPLYMGNKGAVGIRFRIPSMTVGFVCAHLTAHEPRLAERIADYNHIVSTLLFSPLPSSTQKSTIYDSSHLFYLGDLNFRLTLPPTHSLSGSQNRENLVAALDQESTREDLKEYDQLLVEQRKGIVCIGLKEGAFWKFKPSYKYELGEIDKYTLGRMPSWTDRILYATHTDSLDSPETSNITNVLYTSIPAYTTSDHKPIISLLLLPSPVKTNDTSVPVIALPSSYKPTPDPNAFLKKVVGRTLDRTIGLIWWLFTVIGAGSFGVGIFNFALGIGAWKWWRSAPKPSSSPS